MGSSKLGVLSGTDEILLVYYPTTTILIVSTQNSITTLLQQFAPHLPISPSPHLPPHFG
ncbi:MAG: hypothetical protein RMY29_013995 [Nostoc sp. CreGUA01]|nr:hypothetical protein [Nostoc sp. CreGUA01]